MFLQAGSSLKMSMLQIGNDLPAFMVGELSVPKLCVDFPEKEAHSELDRVSKNDGRHCMLEAKDYLCIHMVFLFIAGKR